MDAPLWLIGAGNMGGAMLRGWIADGVAPRRISVIDPVISEVPEGVRLLRSIPQNGPSPDILVLAVKPQQLTEVCGLFSARPDGPRLMISILAGVEIATLAQAIPARQIIRAMPNLPVSIAKGVTVLFADKADDVLRSEATALMAPLGLVEWIDDEQLFDAVTALSGSGPGFVFRFIDALAEAGTALGLPPEQSARLALATVEGAASLAAQSEATPAILADRVASPGGTTREGLNILDENAALGDLLARTLSAAARRSAELVKASRR